MHPNPVHDIAVHHEPGVGTRLYIAVRRVGVVVVDFDPTSTSAFTTVEEIQVGDVAYGLELRELPGGGHDLLLTDYGGGIRVLGN